MVVLYFGMGSLHAHREPPSVINFPFFREGTIRVFTLIVFQKCPDQIFFQKIFKYLLCSWHPKPENLTALPALFHKMAIGHLANRSRR